MEISPKSFELSKQSLRHAIQSKPDVHPFDKETWSLAICSRLNGLDFFQSARNRNRLMIYLSFGNEVRTLSFLSDLSDSSETSLVVPFCEDDEIVPVRIFSRNDLIAGRFGILEPKQEVRNNPDRLVTPEQLDLVLVPGLAFDCSGHRLGRGKGYYDRFLARLTPNTQRIALAFESQIVEHVPVDSWDQPVSIIITENRILRNNSEIT
ncbi:MAG: 5-formyltetrahydrofolate cyclo-ligase [Planctomycetaceae bacterium]|jgi:5-formyltetrahydrofolate cyclo-ligase|nr:5-formyltetrahydrofolate cyclo-ligase [Planctomycetaceae bacterium]